MAQNTIEHNPFKVHVGVADMVFKPSEEAKICLNCTLPDCKNGIACKRYREEKRKLRRSK